MQKLWIGDNPKLEAIFEGEKGLPCAVITHPHPLYGGDMYNNVVEAAKDLALKGGYAALRFNFRGTGGSGGSHDDGQGEIDDLDAAIRYAGNNSMIIGYSFGGWIAARYIIDHPYPCILVAPPTGMFEFPVLKGLDVWAVVGSKDQFCDIDALFDIMDKDRITLCQGIDHFWFGKEAYLAETLPEIMRQVQSGNI